MIRLHPPFHLPGSRFFLCILLISAYSCKKEYVVEERIVEPTSQNLMKSFWFSPALNPSFINDTVSMEINGNTISGRIPYYTSLKSLKPSFETNAAGIEVSGVPQESGITPQDFSYPVHYDLLGSDGNKADYTVNLINFTGLPVIKINTEGSAPIASKEDYVQGHITIDGAGSYADFDGDMKIKGHGNSTWTLPKKPYKFKLDKKQSLLGEPQDKEWILLANYTDKTQIRNETAFFMGQISALDWTPHGHFAELFLNEVYQGTYQLCESVEVAGSRVNVTDDGYLLEVDQLSRLDPDDVYFYTHKMLVNIKEPEVVANDEKYNYIANYVTAAEDALFGSDFTDPETGYAKYLDVPSFVDWYLINEIAKNNDAIFYSSCYMNLSPNGKLKMGPIWDFDIAFGNINYNDNNSPEGFWVKTSPWMTRLFEDPAFVQKVKERFLYFKSQTDTILSNINDVSARLKWSAIENNNKWQTLYNSTWPNYAISGSYDNEVIYMKKWLNARMDWLETAFAGL